MNSTNEKAGPRILMVYQIRRINERCVHHQQGHMKRLARRGSLHWYEHYRCMQEDDEPITMSLTSTFQYEKLIENDAIRLIVLKPAQDLESRVECSLTKRSEWWPGGTLLCFSYPSADAKDTRTISVDGKDLDVTANLESALRHIRDLARSSHIWAGAICTSQTDDEEKSPQAARMGVVYETTRHTVIFLEGPVDEGNTADFILSRSRKI